MEIACPRPAPIVVVAREALHPALAEGSVEATPRSLDPRADRRWRYALCPATAARTLVGPLTLRVLGPVGTGLGTARPPAAETTARLSPRALGRARSADSSRWRTATTSGARLSASQGPGTEPYALRDYPSRRPTVADPLEGDGAPGAARLAGGRLGARRPSR